MPEKRTISLALQEGFLHDKVVVRSGERELAALENLSTRVQIGLARTLELEVEEGEALTISLPDKAIRTELNVDAASPFVSVSVTPDGKALDVKQTDSPPGYL